MLGSKVDATDATSRDAVIRKAEDESDPVVTDIASPPSVITCTEEKLAISTSKDNKSPKRQVTQLSYVVTVDDANDFKVNETEHSIRAWVNTEWLQNLKSRRMKDLVSEKHSIEQRIVHNEKILNELVDPV